MSETRDLLRAEVERLRAKYAKLRQQSLNEETTKAAFINPLLCALGWDVENPELVEFEYKRRSKHSPVDYALKVQRTPGIFIEAKTLGANLDDQKWQGQILNYSVQAGVQWVVLTNGVDYHIYNSSALVPIDRKVFKRLSITSEDEDALINGLMLLERSDFVGKRIEMAWTTHHVDREVGRVLKRLFDVSDVKDPLVGLVARQSKDATLTKAAVRDSLARAIFNVEFPPAPGARDAEAVVDRASATPRKAAESLKRERSRGAPSKLVGLSELIERKVLRPPVSLQASYKGHELRATITKAGTVEFDGKIYDSLSSAGAWARRQHYEGELPKGQGPATNGWEFWKLEHPETGRLVSVGSLRAGV